MHGLRAWESTSRWYEVAPSRQIFEKERRSYQAPVSQPSRHDSNLTASGKTGAVHVGSLKSKRVLWRNYQSREEARADIVEYIAMFYNSRRLHSYLGYQSPDQFERNGQLAKAA